MDLHKEFVKLSFDIIKMKNKLISLLLEIYEQEIYKLHHCRTIYEYGFKYAKLSKEMVDKAIRTLKHLENKPFLKKAIETQGIHKVAMVATIATPENERIFAKHVENLSKPALFEFSKELRHKRQIEAMFPGQIEDAQRNAAGTPQSGAVRKSQPDADGIPQSGASENPQFCQAVPSKMTIELDAEMQILFLKFKKKYAKNLSNREALMVMLKKMDVAENMAETRGTDDVNSMQVKTDGENRKAVANTKSKTAVATANYEIFKSGGDGVAEVVEQESKENPVPGNGNQKYHEGANSGKSMSKTIIPSRYIQKKKTGKFGKNIRISVPIPDA